MDCADPEGNTKEGLGAKLCLGQGAIDMSDARDANDLECGDAPARGQQRRSAVLAIAVLSVLIAELWLLGDPSVPLLLDKLFFGTAIVFQLGIALYFASGRYASLGDCRSHLLDVCHWAFVVMIFSGPVVLRAFGSVLLVAVVTAASLALRLAMQHTCIITSVAARSSLPNISGARVTAIFSGLFVVALTRLWLLVAFGNGFPIGQLFWALGASGAASAVASL